MFNVKIKIFSNSGRIYVKIIQSQTTAEYLLPFGQSRLICMLFIPSSARAELMPRGSVWTIQQHIVIDATFYDYISYIMSCSRFLLFIILLFSSSSSLFFFIQWMNPQLPPFSHSIWNPLCLTSTSNLLSHNHNKGSFDENSILLIFFLLSTWKDDYLMGCL